AAGPFNKILSVAEMEGFIADLRRHRIVDDGKAQSANVSIESIAAERERIRREQIRASMEEERVAHMKIDPRETEEAKVQSAPPRALNHPRLVLAAWAAILLFGFVAYFGRSALSEILSLLGIKQGASFIPGSINNQAAEPTHDTVECSIFGPLAVP